MSDNVLPVVGRTYYDVRVDRNREIVPVEKVVVGVENGVIRINHEFGHTYEYPITENWQRIAWMYDSFLDAVIAYELACATMAAYEEDDIREAQAELAQRVCYHEVRWQNIPAMRAKIKELQDEAAR